MAHIFPLLPRFQALWGRLVRPRCLAPDSIEFRRFTILNTIILSQIVTIFALLPLIPVIVTLVSTTPVYLILLMGLVWSLITFGMARAGHYTAAAVGTVAFMTIAVCAITLIASLDAPLKYLALSSVLGVILFSRKGALRVLLVNVIAASVLSYSMWGGSLEVIADDLLLIIMLSLALLIAVSTTDRHLTQINTQHEALLKSQNRELDWVAENERARVMREWVAFMSHDFRTPLAVMSTTLYVMQRNHKPELNTHRIETLNGQIERLTSLVNHMHAAVSLDSTVRPNLRLQDMMPLIYDVVARVAPLATQLKVGIDVWAEQSLPPLPLDADAIRLALECLLENAVMYNKTDGVVKVRPKVVASHLYLKIEDTGVGIAPNEVPFIFDRFYRVDKARQLELGRNGLGLSIAKMVVEAHQGRIEVRSTLGLGSTFTITLPLEQPQQPPA